MEWLWTWGGVFFGYRRGDNLFTYHGVQAGRFYGKHVHGTDGQYLGELYNHGRLITSRMVIHPTRGAFAPIMGGSYAPYADYAGYAMIAGYEDFPSPDQFR